jgi:hypothetical protein
MNITREDYSICLVRVTHILDGGVNRRGGADGTTKGETVDEYKMAIRLHQIHSSTTATPLRPIHSTFLPDPLLFLIAS